MRINLPDKCQAHVRAVVYKEALLRDGEYVEHATKDRMRQQMAHFITNERIEARETEFTKEYSLDLYVLSYDELVKLIREEAMDYVGFMKGPIL